MAPKAKVSKSEVKAKQKVIEDKTFGLKNKNRSKVIQKQIATTQKSMLGVHMAETEKAKAEKAAKKAALKAAEAEMARLGLADKKKKKKEGEEDAAGPAEGDHFKSSAENEEYLWTAEDFDYADYQDETALEEKLQAELEELKEKLASGEVVGTPVNPETFAAWKVSKRLEAAELVKKKEDRFKKTGCGISGRALFEFDATLFKDDENAWDDYDEEEQEEEDQEEDEEAGDGGSDDDAGGAAGPAHGA